MSEDTGAPGAASSNDANWQELLPGGTQRKKLFYRGKPTMPTVNDELHIYKKPGEQFNIMMSRNGLALQIGSEQRRQFLKMTLATYPSIDDVRDLLNVISAFTGLSLHNLGERDGALVYRLC